MTSHRRLLTLLPDSAKLISAALALALYSSPFHATQSNVIWMVSFSLVAGKKHAKSLLACIVSHQCIFMLPHSPLRMCVAFAWMCLGVCVCARVSWLQSNNIKNKSTGIMLGITFHEAYARPLTIICRLCDTVARSHIHTECGHCCYWRHWIGRKMLWLTLKHISWIA